MKKQQGDQGLTPTVGVGQYMDDFGVRRLADGWLVTAQASTKLEEPKEVSGPMGMTAETQRDTETRQSVAKSPGEVVATIRSWLGVEPAEPVTTIIPLAMPADTDKEVAEAERVIDQLREVCAAAPVDGVDQAVPSVGECVKLIAEWRKKAAKYDELYK